MDDDLLAIGMDVRLLGDIHLNNCDITKIVAGTIGYIAGEMVLSTGIYYSVRFDDLTVVGVRSEELEMV